MWAAAVSNVFADELPPYICYSVVLYRCLVSPCSSKPHSINTNQCLVFIKAWLGAYQVWSCTMMDPLLLSPVCPAPRWPYGVSMDQALSAAVQTLQVCLLPSSSSAACCNSYKVWRLFLGFSCQCAGRWFVQSFFLRFSKRTFLYASAASKEQTSPVCGLCYEMPVPIAAAPGQAYPLAA